MNNDTFRIAANRVMASRHLLADLDCFANLNDFCLDLMGLLLDMGKGA